MNDGAQHEPDDAPQAKSLEDLDTETRLHDALNEWDRNRPPEPEPGPDKFDVTEMEEKIAALEGEKGEWATAKEELEKQLAEQTEHAKESDALMEDVARFSDEAHEAIDRHDHGRLLDHLHAEIGIDRHLADMELRMRLIEDAEFREAADGRFDDPDAFQRMVQNLQDDLQEKYSERRDDHDRGLGSAVRASRDVMVSPSSGGYSGVDWGHLTTQEFAAKSREVYDAMKQGKLQSSQRGGGFFTTDPRRLK